MCCRVRAPSLPHCRQSYHLSPQGSFKTQYSQINKYIDIGFPGGTSSKKKNPPANEEKMRHRFNPWVRMFPWRRAWQPTPVLLPGESYGQRSLAGYCPWGHQESDMTEQVTLSLISATLLTRTKRLKQPKVCWKVNKWTVCVPQCGIFFSLKKEENSDMCYNTDEHWRPLCYMK